MKDGKIKNICIISQGYPTEKQPWFPFVDQLLCAMSEQGVHCTVISPQSISKNVVRNGEIRPVFWQREHKGHKIDIYQPKYLSFSNLKIGKYYLTHLTFEKQVIKCFAKLGQKFDAVYGHFWICGLIAAKIGQAYGIPAFMACGESKINYDALKRNLRYKDQLKGIVCVSSKSRDESLALGLCSADKTIVCPNAIDTEKFYAMDRVVCREELGANQEDFVVAFVGAFSARKGSRRLSQALSRIDGVKSIFIGKGDEIPECDGQIYAGPLPHDQICKYLCAADVFVLPTRNEGCCNAIVEAMACGLPIISSDLQFNDDILNEACSIRIDPDDIDALEKAIRTLVEDPERRCSMRQASLEMAKSLTLPERARKILAFIEEHIY